MDRRPIDRYYEKYDEESRLAPPHGQVEFLTTMHALRPLLAPGMRVLELGAGTGRYTVALAREGYRVDAVELVESNLEKLRRKLTAQDQVNAVQGNALDLSRYPDETFDITLSLGPMYHLFGAEDRLTALNEAIRVTKTGGYLLVAYCLGDASLLQDGFIYGYWDEMKDSLTEDYRFESRPESVFSLLRVDDIDALDAQLPAQRRALIATDGATAYIRSAVDAMDEERFAAYLGYHLQNCERRDLIGASNHVLDVLQKTPAKFRTMRRRAQQTDDQAARAMLESASHGVLALAGDDGYPYALPISFALRGDTIYFHSAPVGHKMDAIARQSKASMAVVIEDTVLGEQFTTRYQSAIAFGRIRRVTDQAEYRDALRAIAGKYCAQLPEAAREQRIAGEKTAALLAMEIDQLTGKRGRAFKA